jgi:uncharacterized protein (TIGR02118 family)
MGEMNHMVKMIALFRRPPDVATFLEHYEQVHLPLVRQMPGLRRLEVHRMFDPRGGEPDPFLMAEMYFDSRESLMEAMNSPQGRAGGKDLKAFAADIVQIFLAEVESEVL